MTTDVVGKKTIRVVAAVVEHEGHYLITQRRESAVLPLLWEFPGGRVESSPGKEEEDEDALKRELRERLGAEARIGKKLGEKVHEYDGYRVALALYEATLVEGKPLEARRVKDFRWVRSSDFDKYPFPDADQQTMDQLLGFTRG